MADHSAFRRGKLKVKCNDVKHVWQAGQEQKMLCIFNSVFECLKDHTDVSASLVHLLQNVYAFITAGCSPKLCKLLGTWNLLMTVVISQWTSSSVLLLWKKHDVCVLMIEESIKMKKNCCCGKILADKKLQQSLLLYSVAFMSSIVRNSDT